jgi:hypothetical protein
VVPKCLIVDREFGTITYCQYDSYVFWGSLFGSQFDTKNGGRERGYCGRFRPANMLNTSSEIPPSNPPHMIALPVQVRIGPPRMTIASPTSCVTAMIAKAISARFDLGSSLAIFACAGG